jgi:hypothetical protein
MGGVRKGKCTDKSGDILALSLDFLKEKEHEVEEKYYTRIDEHIGSTCYTEKLPDKIHHLWEKSQEKESSSDPEKYEKMQCIKALTTSNSRCKYRDNNSRNDEKYLKKIHKTKG